ncbi:hypothetical protein [Hymenobacter baengnokdamensis]|uniref:hypothetical protein n=1 Tax=Hymenobacter baengnokdamensis TaxID=2615203 RepID=UPI001248E89D|nr:hypothetical protein [Hymenobacter baengnokdamensis]
MTTYSPSAPESVPATEASDVQATIVPCPIVAAVKARAKALKKLRKHENKRFFFSWCACLHALGFSF